MKILNHPACTHQLGAPSDMQDGSCDALPVMYQTTEHGQFAVSFWQPEPDDLAELLAGGGINLWVRAPGRQHPVVALGTFPQPPTDEKSALFIENAKLLGVPTAILCQMRIELRTMIEEATKWRNQAAALNQDAERFRKLHSNLCGYIENGGGETLKIYQDDATREWILHIGKRTYHAGSFAGVVDAALEKEGDKS